MNMINVELPSMEIDYEALGDTDARDVMAWDVAYPLIGMHKCTFCRGSKWVPRDDLMVTKEPHELQPRGHLYVRCPDHQAQRDKEIQAMSTPQYTAEM